MVHDHSPLLRCRKLEPCAHGSVTRPPYPPLLAFRRGTLPRHRWQLILDLDETLVHSCFKPVAWADYSLSIDVDGTFYNVSGGVRAADDGKGHEGLFPTALSSMGGGLMFERKKRERGERRGRNEGGERAAAAGQGSGCRMRVGYQAYLPTPGDGSFSPQTFSGLDEWWQAEGKIERRNKRGESRGHVRETCFFHGA